MKKSFIIILNLIFIFSACQNKKQITNLVYTPTYKEIKNEDISAKNKNTRDSIKENFLNKNDSNNPIKIISSQLFKNEYSNHKDIKIVYKNSTKKNIKAIKLEWYCENSFNEPAHGKFFYIQGKSTEDISELLKAGHISSRIWEDFSTDAYKILKARAYYVAFTDGTTWELK